MFSHGDQVTFKHPHFEAISRALNVVLMSRSFLSSPHILFCGPQYGSQAEAMADDSSEVVCDSLNLMAAYRHNGRYSHNFAQFCGEELNGYRMVLTNFNVFSTYTQGDILFVIDSSGNMLPPIWYKRVGNELGNDLPSIIQGYLHGTKLAENVMSFNFSGFPQLAAAFLELDIQIAQMPYLSEVAFTGITVQEDVMSLSTVEDDVTFSVVAVAVAPVVKILRSHIDRLKAAFSSQRRFIVKEDITSDAVDDAV